MKFDRPPRRGEYVDVQFYQANRGTSFELVWTTLTWLCGALLSPFIVASRASNVLFKACSEALSIVPSLFGFVLRYAFYKFTLTSCGNNVLIDFGTVFYCREIVIGNDVTFGMGIIVHQCDFGDNVLIADGCRFVGGTKKHRHDRLDVPICRQGGSIKKILIGDDSWIDCGAIIMEDVGKGSIIRAGSVIVEPVAPYSVCAGNPASVIDRRR